MQSRLTLVIDDYQRATGAEADLDIAELARASPMLSLVVISRRVVLLDGPLVTASLNVRLIDIHALSLTPAEATRLADVVGTPPTARLSVALERAAGWPLAVHAALNFRNSAHTVGATPEESLRGSRVPSETDPLENLDAFALGSLQMLTEQERRVLLAAADLDGVSARQIQGLLGVSGPAQTDVCNRLYEYGLLTRIRSPGSTEYHCHPAVLAPLAEHSRRTVDPDERRQSFLERAAEIAVSSPAAAFSLFCAAEDFGAAERILEQNFSSITLDASRAVRALRSIPPTVLGTHPAFSAALLVLEHSLPEAASSRMRSLLRCWLRAVARRLPSPGNASARPADLHVVCQAMVLNRISGRLDHAQRFMRQLEELLDLDPTFPQAQGAAVAQHEDGPLSVSGSLPSIYRELATTALALGQITRAQAMLVRLLSISQQPTKWRDVPLMGSRTLPAESLRNGWRRAALAELALADAVDGDLRSSGNRLRQFDAAAHDAAEFSPGTLWSGAEVARAFQASEHGDARELEQATARLSAFGDRLEPWPLLLIAQSSHIWRERGPGAALTHLTAGLGSAPAEAALAPPWHDSITTFEATLNSALGNLVRAKQLLQRFPASQTAVQLEHARLALFASRDVEAMLLAEGVGDPQASRRRRVDSRLIHALAAWGCGQHPEAIAACCAAAKLIEQYQLESALLGVPYPELHALAETARAAAGCTLINAVERIPLPARAVRYEPLTERELRALAAISKHQHAGLAAESLFVTTGTVKKHLASVYRKLGVSDRDAAILRASRMGILTQPSAAMPKPRND
ncbi:helix-turn-helix transcriptional regulator [Leucobacter sp. BZR 635]